MEHTLTMECPRCHRTHEVHVEDTINAEKDQDAVTSLIEGTYFIQECPYCGAPIHLTYGLLYHDPRHKVMCFLCTDENSVQQTVQSIKAAQNTEEGKKLEGYELRIVTDDRQLQEKALIWDLGYDDKAVEMWKLTYLYHVVAHREDFEADESILHKGKDGYQIAFYNKGEYIGVVDADINLVPDVEKRFLSRDTGVKRNDLFVDEAWAMQHLTDLLHRKQLVKANVSHADEDETQEETKAS